MGVENDDTLKLHLKDMDLEFSWPVGKIKEVIPDLGSVTVSSPTPCSLEIARAISILVEEHKIPEAKVGLASGVSAFLWLYTAIHGCVVSLLILKAYSDSNAKCFAVSNSFGFSCFVGVNQQKLLSLLSFHLDQVWVHQLHFVSLSQPPFLLYQTL